MNFKRKFGAVLSLLFILIFVGCPVLAQDSNKTQRQTESLPASYDLRNVDGKNYVTPVKNQGELGTCWAQTAMSCAETNSILKGGSDNILLSPKSLSWFSYQFQGPIGADSDELEGIQAGTFTVDDESLGYENFTNTYNMGGTANVAPNQLSTWLGASTEKQAPYQNSNGDIIDFFGAVIISPGGDWSLDYFDIYNNAFHLQNSETVWGPSSGKSVDEYLPKAKALMLKSGALDISYFGISNAQESEYLKEGTFAQYCPPEAHKPSNHAVTVVGWDDNYPKENFKTTPPGDGAWIVKNSWGSNWGDNGYFYLSYYDSTLSGFTSFDVETPELGYSYDKNYQYDYEGDKQSVTAQQGLTGLMVDQWIDTLTQSSSEVNSDQYSFANVFTSEGNELLKAVSAYTVLPGAQITAKVYLLNEGYSSPEDGELVETITATEENQGFYTLKLNNPISLSPGQKYSVVENIVYPVTVNNQTTQIPAFSLEYGLTNQLTHWLQNDKGQKIGYAIQNVTAKANEGESYISGLNNVSGGSSNSWSDITDLETYQQLSKSSNFIINDIQTDNTIVPGNCMIKAYTSENEPGAVLPTGVEFSPGSIYLTTEITGTTSIDLSASITPSNATGGITYSFYPETVASVTQDGNVAHVSAVSEGEGKLVARTVNGYVATKDIIVTNNKYVNDGVTVMDNGTQDSLAIQVNNLFPNPALGNESNATSVSVFVWSADDMSDVQALPAKRQSGTDNWLTDSFGINQTDSYLLNADNIKYVVYTGDSNNSLNNMVFSGFTSWVHPGLVGERSVSYISYNQNVGFVEPTVHSGTSGKINDPDSVHMEGLRVSSEIQGVNVITSVHAAGIGWMDPVGDGVYAGTMHQNRALEAVKMELETTLDNYQLSYRVYVAGQGWTDWVQEGEVAGTTGKATPIQAVDIQIVPVSNQ